MSRRRRNPVTWDFGEMLKWGAIIAGAYFVYKAIKGVGSIGTGIAQTAEQAGSAVADLFPTNIAQPGGSFTVHLADGTVATVPYGWRQGDPIPRDTSSDIDLSNAGNF